MKTKITMQATIATAKATMPIFLHKSFDSDQVDASPSGVVTATPEELVLTTVVAVVAT